MRSRLMTSTVGEHVVDAPDHGHAHALEDAGDEGGRADEGDLRAELEQAPDVGARDAAEEDVADDGDVEAVDAPAFFADREQVEQRLGGVLVRAVARVDDAGVEALREELGGPGGGVAQDDDVDVVGLEDEGGVLEGLALDEARTAGGNVDHVGAQAHRREFKARAGAGAGFDEEVDQRPAAQGGDFFHVARTDLLELTRGVEQEGDFGRAQVLDRQQILAPPEGGGGTGGGGVQSGETVSENGGESRQIRRVVRLGGRFPGQSVSFVTV